MAVVGGAGVYTLPAYTKGVDWSELARNVELALETRVHMYKMIIVTMWYLHIHMFACYMRASSYS